MRGPPSQTPAAGRPPPGAPGGQAGQEIGGPPVLTITATGQRIALHAEITNVGRGDGAGIRLDDPSVSVLHADLVRRGPHTYVADLGRSARGTRVNGRPVAWMLLAAGDVLHFGAAAAVITALALWAADRDGLPYGKLGISEGPDRRAWLASAAAADLAGRAAREP
jgi:FHA domain